MKNTGFQNKPMYDSAAVGRTTARSARLWIRARSPGSLTVEWRPQKHPQHARKKRITVNPENESDNTISVVLPSEPEEEGVGLDPLTRYNFRITAADESRVLAQGAFETAPEKPEDTPERFAVAVMSCHQPFNSRGTVRKSARLVLKAAEKCLSDHNTKIVFMVGDQMYSDYPKKLSLFDEKYFPNVAPPGRDSILSCKDTEVRKLFHERYRHFWALPEWQRLHMRFPCYPILDDHDLVDNWGSVPAHQEPLWRNFITGARWACFDYQASRILPAAAAMPKSFHFSGSYGYCAYFVMDLRSERRAGPNGRIIGPQQKQDFVSFLKNSRQSKIIFLILSVPLLHLPRFLTRLIARMPPPNEDFSDRWSSGRHIRDRDWLLKTVHDHQQSNPEQRIILLSGDIHIGCVHRIDWGDSAPNSYQFISSGFTHKTGWVVSNGSKLLIRANQHIETTDRSLEARMDLLKGLPRKRQNPCGNLNMGIVEVDRGTNNPRVRFFLYNQRRGQPIRAFQSHWL
ncbi:MAG: alkaline phosphatase D family protein [Desulfobacterales bacterium]